MTSQKSFARSGDRRLPGGPPGTPALDPVVLFDVPTGAAVAVFLGLSALAHALVCTVWWRRYLADLDRSRNPARWVERGCPGVRGI